MNKVLIALPIVLLACDDSQGPGTDDPVGADEAAVEARRAVEEVSAVTETDDASAQLVEVSTDVTVGEEMEAAAEALAAFWESQEDCTTVTVDWNVITVDFGTLNDDCAFNGSTYAGVDVITLDNVLFGDLEVRHDFQQFTNGRVTIDGTADVTWLEDDAARNVVSSYTVADFVDATIVEIDGEHVIARLDPAVPVWEGGFTLDGQRSWTRGDAAWSAELNGVQYLPGDGGASAGSVRVTNPRGAELTIEYDRVDADTTSATVTHPDGDVFVFHVTVDGEIEDAD